MDEKLLNINTDLKTYNPFSSATQQSLSLLLEIQNIQTNLIQSFVKKQALPHFSQSSFKSHASNFSNISKEMSEFFEEGEFGSKKNTFGSFYPNLIQKNFTQNSIIASENIKSLTSNSIKSLRNNNISEPSIISTSCPLNISNEQEVRTNLNINLLQNLNITKQPKPSKLNTNITKFEDPPLLKKKRKTDSPQKEDTKKSSKEIKIKKSKNACCQSFSEKIVTKKQKLFHYCDHQGCNIEFRTKKLKVMHHNKMEPNCKADRGVIVRLIGKYKKSLLNLMSRVRKDVTKNPLLDDLKQYYNSIIGEVYDSTLFSILVGDSFDDAPKEN
jgi:hypothetical protein